MFVFVYSEIATRVWQRTGCLSLCTKRFTTYLLFLEEKEFWLLDSSSRQAEDISELHGLGWLNLEVADAPVSPFHCHEKRDRVKSFAPFKVFPLVLPACVLLCSAFKFGSRISGYTFSNAANWFRKSKKALVGLFSQIVTFLVKGGINQINKARCKNFIASLLINRKKPKSDSVIIVLYSS